MDVAPSLVDAVVADLDAGRCLDALERARAAGPLRAWSGAGAQVAASRLASHLGAPRLGAFLVTRARREHPTAGVVRAYWADHQMNRAGPLAAHDEAVAAEADSSVELTDEDRADLWIVRALVAACYRDGETATALLDRARALRPGHPWPVVAAAFAASFEDRPADALALAREALVLRPHYRPALLEAAGQLERARRLDEAVALVEASFDVNQSPALPGFVHDLLAHTAEPERLLALLDRVERASPLRDDDPTAVRWLAIARCRAHGRRGDHAAAAREAQRVGDPWHGRLATRLARPDPAWRRVRLAVPVESQAYRTCGPATLAALSRFLGEPHEQSAVVAAIWDGGTEAHAERSWCETNGFVARELRVTWEAARSLVDAGIPFALETKAADSGHLQPLVGYDDARRSLLVQEPSGAEVEEMDAQTLFDAHALHGPRGLAFVPEAERARLEGLDLPDADLYDLAYAARRALSRFDRVAAVAAADAVDARSPGHALGALVRLAVADLDHDEAEALRVVDGLLARHPRDARLVARRAALLRSAGLRAERVAWLERAVTDGLDPAAFRRDLAHELLLDARAWPRVRRLLRAAHRASPRNAWTLAATADLDECCGAHERALLLRRFATSLDDTDEPLAVAFCDAAYAAGRLEEALAWLRRRVAAHGARSGGPAATLADVLRRHGRVDEAADVLRTALEARADDGELRLAAAELERRRGDVSAARAHLDAARPGARPSRWSRADAALRRQVGDLAGSLAAWRSVLEREPLSLDAHRAVAWHLAAGERPAAAVAHLEAACARFPHHLGLAALLLARVRDADPVRAEAIVRRVVALEPSDAWWRRELAILLERTGRLEEAVVAAQDALDLAPHAAASYGILADLHRHAGRTERAHEGFRAAVRADVDYDWALTRLLSTAPDDATRREDLALVAAELRRQPTDGSGVRAYATEARAVLEPATLTDALVALHAARPEVPATASVLVAHRLATGDAEGALTSAEAACARFPTDASAWRDLATVRRRRGDAAGAAEAARRAVTLDPDLDAGWVALAHHHRDAGAPDAAVAVLREALRFDPSSSWLSTELAEVLLRRGDRAGAWQVAARVARDDPAYDAAWDVLREVAAADEPGRDRAALVALAREGTREHPGAADAWMALGSVLPDAAQDERLDALRRAAALDPLRGEAYDQQARWLATQGRFDEARAALRAGPWPEASRPVPLLGRDAWLLAEEGKRRDAIAAMTRVVDGAGDYAWGWQRLAEWAEAEEDLATWARATEALLRLMPSQPSPCAEAADVALRRGERGRALEHLRAALARDPGYGYAGWRLLGLAWEARSRAELDDLVARLRPEGTTGMLAAAARALRAGLDGAETAARDAVRGVLEAPSTSPAVVDLLGRAFGEHLGPPWARRFERWLERAVRDDVASAGALRHWLARTAPRRWPATDAVVAWTRRLGADADAVLADLLDAAGEARKGARVVRPLVAALGDRLRGDPSLWGKTGYALCESRLDADAVAWLAGGAERPDAEGWMLWNLVLALRRLGRDREAEATSLAVVRRGLRDATFDSHAAYAAYGEAVAGRFDQARAVLDAAPPPARGGAPTSAELVRGLAVAIVDVAGAPTPEQANARFEVRRLEVRALASSLPAAASDDARRWDEATRALSKAAGRRRPWADRRLPRAERRLGGWVWLLAIVLYALMQLAKFLGSRRVGR